ncbi:MAG: isoprenyl transferase [Christensenellales bacterium]|jgi:undecaprenyl diphosphate synthase
MRLRDRFDADKPLPALPENMPRHVAVIMDGNGRWAQKKGLPRSVGHATGVEALRGIIRSSSDWGIESLTIYAFSTENWARPEGEVSALMQLILRYFKSEIDELYEKGVKIQILGDVDGLPAPQRDAVVKAMQRTKDNRGLKLNIALNYGGRQELVRCAKLLAKDVSEGRIAPEDIDEEAFSERLYTAGQSDVDLVIRTSGEMRLSNFLPWQSAYAEMLFNDTLWPDYTAEEYRRDLFRYAERSRRFGKVK